MKKLSPITVYYIRNGFDAFNSGLIFTALYVYYARTLALTPLQLAFVGTLHMLTHVLLEVPTGIVADVYSRKASVILGGLLTGICFVVTGTIPLYGAVLFATLVEAMGDTFVSGALDAWLTDEVGADKFGSVILRSEQLGMPLHWVGVAVSVLLSTLFTSQAPILLGGALWLVATVVLLVVMPETGFVRPAAAPVTLSLRSGWLHMASTFGDSVRLVRGQRTLFMLFVAQLFIGAFMGGFYGLDQLHLFTGFTLPVLKLPWIGALNESAWIALIDGAKSPLYFLGIAMLRRNLDVGDPTATAKALLGLFTLAGVAAMAFALSPSFGVAVVTLCALGTIENLTEPLLRTWLNQHITSDVRATVLSMNTQVHRFGMLGGGLGIGALGNVAGLRIALSVAALFLLPLLTLLKRETRNDIYVTGDVVENEESFTAL